MATTSVLSRSYDISVVDYFPNIFQEISYEYSCILRCVTRGYNLLNTTSAAVEVLLLHVNLYRPWFSSRLDSSATAVTTAVRRTISKRTAVLFSVRLVLLLCDCLIYRTSYLVCGVSYIYIYMASKRPHITSTTEYQSFKPLVLQVLRSAQSLQFNS